MAGSQVELTLIFSIAPQPLRWGNISLSANYVAEYFASLLAKIYNDPDKANSHQEMHSAISYIANELLENCAKYHYDKGSTISLSLRLFSGEIVFLATNRVDPQVAPKFYNLIDEITQNDPAELLVRQLEQNADSEEGSSSGLGYITMLNDYQAHLGWKFEINQEQPEEINVTTLVRLPIGKEAELEEFSSYTEGS